MLQGQIKQFHLRTSNSNSLLYVTSGPDFMDNPICISGYLDKKHYACFWSYLSSIYVPSECMHYAKRKRLSSCSFYFVF